MEHASPFYCNFKSSNLNARPMSLNMLILGDYGEFEKVNKKFMFHCACCILHVAFH
jgi:hypothetical protein